MVIVRRQYTARSGRYSAAVPPAADLTVIVPTYNERPRLAELTAALFDATARAGLALQLVVVDDNSPDGTGALADELARTRRMTVIHRAGKLGLGSAVIEGFQAAGADVIGVMDADFSHPPSEVPAMYAACRASGADMLVASRYIPGGSTANWPRRRRWLSRLGCLLSRPLTPVRDATSGFFFIRRATALDVTIEARGFKIALELLLRARLGIVAEAPYRFDDRQQGESKMTLREGAGYLRQLAHFYVGMLSARRPRRPRYQRLTLEDLDAARRDRAPVGGR